MNDKELFDGYMKIAEYAVKNFHGRREFEWKVTLGFWALLAATITFVHQNPSSAIAKAISPGLILGAIAGFAFLWLRATWVANDNDKGLAHHFLYAAESILRGIEGPINQRPRKLTVRRAKWWFGWLWDWSPWFQLLTTCALGAALYLAKP